MVSLIKRISSDHMVDYPNFVSRTLTYINERGEVNGQETERVWLPPLSTEGIMNPGPFTGKKYQKRLRKALKEHMDDAEYILKSSIPDLDILNDGHIEESDVTFSSLPSRSDSMNSKRCNDDSGVFALCGKKNKLLGDQDDACEILLHTYDDNDRLKNIQRQANLKLTSLDHQLSLAKRQYLKLANENWPNTEKVVNDLEINARLQKQLEGKINALKNCLKTIECLDIAVNPTKVIDDRILSTKLVYYDNGNHLCSICNKLFSSVRLYLLHTHNEHNDSFMGISTEEDYDDDSELSMQNINGSSVKMIPYQGCEFLHPCCEYFCHLCKTKVTSESDAKTHLRSMEHNDNYKKYCLENPGYRYAKGFQESPINLKAGKNNSISERTKTLKDSEIHLNVIQNIKHSMLVETRPELSDVDEANFNAKSEPEEVILSSDSEDVEENDDFTYKPNNASWDDLELLERRCLESIALIESDK